MNKAFVREPDATDCLCPRCQGLGLAVPLQTVEIFVPAEKRRHLTASCYFCETPRCSVAYFDGMESAVLVTDLICQIFPKESEAPLCRCFGFVADDIRADIEEGVPTRIRALLAQSKTPAARCAELSPTGVCCLPQVQRNYFRWKERPVS